MEDNQTDILDSNFRGNIPLRRRKLLPWWIKAFTWVFLIFGAIAPLCLILGIMGYQFQLSIYGIATNEPLSAIGLSLTGLFIFKGITAFGLWTEKDWAINLGQIDAIIGITLCTYLMITNPFFADQPGYKMNLRLELILLIPFLYKLYKIKKDWNHPIRTKNS